MIGCSRSATCRLAARRPSFTRASMTRSRSGHGSSRQRISNRTDFQFPKEKTMSVERHESGPRMSQVVIHGNTVYLAGVVARNASGKSMTEQTQDVLKSIDGYLAQAGTDKSRLLSANIWITDMAKFTEMNAVWDAWVSPGNTPARATVEAKLAAPGYNVEIMVVAAR